MSRFRQPTKRRRARVQELEPRILLSFDLPGLPLAAALPGTEPEAQPALVEALAGHETRDGCVEQPFVRREIVFVDAGVEGREDLVAGLLVGGDAESCVEVVVLDASRDGLEQVSEALAAFEGDLDAVHVVSHGSDGGVQLGGTWLTAQDLAARAELVGGWSAALSAEADILLYGCNLASSAEGRLLVDDLAALTGADVAASRDLTGSAERGGDWDLEYTSGRLEATTGLLADSGWQGVLAVVTSHESANQQREINDTDSWGQTFSHASGSGSYDVNMLALRLSRDPGLPSGGLTVSLRDGWNGTVLGSATLPASALSTSMTWHAFDVGAQTLVDGQTYVIRVDGSASADKLYVAFDNASGYANGDMIDKNGSLRPGEDLAFRVAFNSAPTVVAAAFGVAEGSPSGTVLGSLSAVDPDPLDVLDFAITSGNAGGAFAIDSSGLLTVANPAAIDFETRPSYALTVEVTDLLGSVTSAPVAVYVSDANDAPAVSGGPFAIDENSADGSHVGFVTASDQDAGDVLSFAIVAGNTGGAFAIDAATGELTVADSSALDYETTPQFQLQVQVSDDGSPVQAGIATVTIDLNDQSDSAPLIANQAFSVDENAAAGTAVGTVVASDPDTSSLRKIYWVDAFAGKVQRSDLDGSNVEDLISGLAEPLDLALDLTGGKLYFVDWVAGKLQRANLDGSGLEDLVTGLGEPRGVALDLAAGKVYWTDSGTDKIQRANLDGSGVEDLVTGLDEPRGLALDPAGGRMYWTDVGSDRIQRANLDGSGVQTLVAGMGLQNARGIALDLAAGKMYWADWTTGKIQRANLDGSGVEDWITGLAQPIGVTLDLSVGKIYWSDQADGVFRANLDGSAVEQLVSGLNFALGVALGPDPGADTLTYAITAGNGGGAFAIDAGTGALSVADPALLDFETAPSFPLTVEVTDASGRSASATVTVSLNDLNETPTALADGYSALEDVLLLVSPSSGVLANDSDPEGNPLSASLVSDVSNGTLVLSADGSFSYLPDPEWSGTDSFSYRVDDGALFGNVVTVTIDVASQADLPVSVSEAYGVPEDGSLSVGAGSGVLANDSDADGDALSAVLISDVSNGSLVLSADGSFTYTPNPDYYGPDSFQYAANDGSGNGSTVTVDIAVAPVNDAPVALAEAYGMLEDGTLVVGGSGVLANDSDVDGDALAAVLVEDAKNGALSLNPDGSFAYAPDADWSGVETFRYKVNDGTTDGNTVTVTVVVIAQNDAPLASPDGYRVNPSATLNANASRGVLANDADADGDALTAVLVSSPANGTLSFAPDGSFTYTPTTGYSGPDSFSYLANDGTVDGNVVTVTIDVSKPSVPMPGPAPEPEPLPEPDPEPEPAEGGSSEPASIPAAAPPAIPGPEVAAPVEPPDPQPVAPAFAQKTELAAPEPEPLALGAAGAAFQAEESDEREPFVPAETEFAPFSFFQELRVLLGELDGVRSEVDAVREGVEAGVVGSSLTAVLGLSVGYLMLLTRGGLLLASLLSSMPAWRLVDPLPVLRRLGEIDASDADDSLHSLVWPQPEPSPADTEGTLRAGDD